MYVQHGKKNSMQLILIQQHSSLPGEHNKECLLAERSNKHLFPLLILEDCQVSVAVSCSFFPSPGWWHLALKRQRSVDAQQQGASYKNPLCCCSGFWLPKTPALCQSPHKHKTPAISKRSNLRLACVLLWSPPSLIPVQPPPEHLGMSFTRKCRGWTGSFWILDEIELVHLAWLSS